MKHCINHDYIYTVKIPPTDPSPSSTLILLDLSSHLQVVKCGLIQQFKTTIDENGKFKYYSSDMRPVPPGRLAVYTLCRMLDIYPCCVQAGTIWTRASTAFRWAGTRWGARSEVCQVSTHENKFKYIYSISCNFLWFPLKYIISIQGFTVVVEKFRYLRNHYRYYLFIEIE